jgi:hypothetical protein
MGDDMTLFYHLFFNSRVLPSRDRACLLPFFAGRLDRGHFAPGRQLLARAPRADIHDPWTPQSSERRDHPGFHASWAAAAAGSRVRDRWSGASENYYCVTIINAG